jgi:DNA-binding HxlR family transcriptional regulator
LTDNLRELESKGLVSRKVYPEVPPRVEYSMTKLGATLLPVLNAMAAWGNNYKKNLK